MADFLETLQSALGDAYQIKRELTAGGMSRLVLASDTAAFDRLVVVKVLPPDLVSALSTARFRREVDVTAHLQHPHILPVLGAGTREGLLYYIMPYVEGESLRRRLERGERYSVAGALRLLQEVADALAYAHGRGVVHRDIKPENILLADEHALVADFGIARGAMSPTLDSTMGTATGTSLGTLGYMAPEQLFATGPVDARADIYSLAVVAYELLSGTPPFTANSPTALAAAHLSEIPRPITQVASSVPESVSAALARALAKDPNDRQQSAAELRETFESALSLLHTGTTGQRLLPRRSRATVLVGAVAGVLALLAAGVAIMRRTSAPPDVDVNRILVVPFNLPEGVRFATWDGADLWSSTMLNVATRHLDGVGPLTTVDAATVAREWKGLNDAVTARALAIDHEAGLVVYGDIAAGGGDSVIARAQVLDIARGKTLGSVRVDGVEARPDRLAADLALGILNVLKEVRQITATPNAGLGSRSPPAVKEFAKGEGYYRNTRWDSALIHYERAVAIDSTFALALRRAGQSISWLRGIDDPESRAYLLRAGEFNRNLSLHDSLLITADSLSSALPGDDADPAWLPKVKRLFAVWNDAVRLYPSDPEVWYGRGDAGHHYGYGPQVGVVDRQVLGDFTRAIELNRSFAPAYEHAIELAFSLNFADMARRYAEWYLALNPQREETSTIRLAKEIADYAVAQSAELDVLLDTANAEQLGRAWLMLRRWPDPQETALRMARALAKRGAADNLFPDPRLRLSLQLSYRGHAEEAGRLVEPGDLRSLAVDYALVGAIPAEQANATFRSWLDDYARKGGGVFPWWTLPWWVRQRDQASIQLIQELASRSAQSGDSAERLVAPYVSRAASGYLDLVRGDSARALATLRALPDSLCVACYLDRLETARLLGRYGEPERAALLLDERPNRLLTPMEIPMSMERARIASRMDNDEKALYAYTSVANAWARADSSLGALVNEAKTRIASSPGTGSLGSEVRLK